MGNPRAEAMAFAQQPSKTMKVRVIYRPPGPGYEGLSIRAIEIDSQCPCCGTLRGRPRNHNFHEDGEWYSCDKWENACGHPDMYAEVIFESQLAERAEALGLHPGLGRLAYRMRRSGDGEILVVIPNGLELSGSQEEDGVNAISAKDLVGCLREAWA
jgi:hypothetical protein